MFGPTIEIQAVIGAQDIGDRPRLRRVDILRRPCFDEMIDRLGAGHLYVPSQRQEIFRGQLGGLQVTHIGNPHLPRTPVERPAHFLADQRGGRGGEPEIGERRAKIGKMIIDP